MSDTAHPLGTPPPTDTPTATVADEQSAPPNSMSDFVVCPVNHATRDPKFSPGVGQAFFSTELGARAPRSLGPIRMPVISRSVQDPAAVVQAATYWQTKYKSQCLCIFPSQGWIVEDLWDSEDLHIEGRKFCEEMLTFISRSTYYVADKFAKDWARAHPERVDFTGLRMGNVYDINDPLDIIDQIFVFGEPLDFPRVFLWHVAHILITTWIEMNKATNVTLRMSLTPQARAVGQQAASGGPEPSLTPVGASDDKKSSKKNRKTKRFRPSKLTTPTESSSAVNKPDLTSIAASAAPEQSSTRLVPQRVPPQGLVQPDGQPGLLRGGDESILVGPSRGSPNVHALPLSIPKANRNVGSGSYGQQHGWVENNNRTMYGAYPRQPSGPMPSMQAPHFMPPQMAIDQHISQPMMAGAPPYVQMAPPGYGFPHPDLGLMSRAQVNYQQGMMHTQPMSPAFPHQPHGQSVSMGNMTNNMHHANNFMLQHQDPRVPIPRRSHPRNAQDLYDPYGGNNPKFNGASGHNNGGRKGGNYGFAAQPGRGRKVSNLGGRDSYNRSNADFNAHVSSGGPRHTDFNARRRLSEDDPDITGDSISGCGHTWIGPKNSTVNELWVGDLPPDTTEAELIHLFKHAVGIAPISVSLRNKIPQNSVHAFATFASFSDAKAALGITRLNPPLRGFRPTVSVPRRFYQKDLLSTSGYFDQAHTGHTTDRTVRDATSTSIQQEENPATDADSDPATASGKALYSPQDARSGLLKKPSMHSEVTDRPEKEDVKLEMPKRQQKSPTKKGKGKGKRESPVKTADLAEENTNTLGKLRADDPVITKEEEIDTEPMNTFPVPMKPAGDNATTLSGEHIASPSDSTLVVDQSANTACDSILQTQKDLETLQAKHTETPSSKERSTDISLDPAGVFGEVLETATDAISAAEGVKNTGNTLPRTTTEESSPKVADENLSDDEAKNDTSFHSAPETQPDSVQAELQPKVEDKAMTTNQDTSELPPMPTETNVNEFSTLTTQRSTTQSEQSATAPLKEETTTQAPTSDSTQDLTTNTIALDSLAMSTAADVSPADATKKTGASQMQSLHPFAKSKSQAKREKEAKKKQQKRGDADRIAKMKADKASASKKLNDGLSIQPKTGSLNESVNSSAAADAVVNTEVTHSWSGGDTTTGNEKSKGKAETQTAVTSSVNGENKIVAEGENGKLDGATKESKEIPSVTHKADKMEAANAGPAIQGSLSRSVAALVTEHAPSPAPPVPPVTPEAQAQEVNDPHKLTSNQPTHAPGSQVSQIDSTSGPTVLPPMANDSVSPQHNKPPSVYHSRSSSNTTLVGDENQVRPLVSPAPAPTALDPSQPASVSTETSKLDAAPTVAPKKKKKKPKKKNKTAATASGSVVVPSVDPDTTGTEEDYRFYDPFESQLSHIDAIRRAVKYDTTSYIARTNARIEKEAEERKEAGQPPKAR